MKKRDRIRKRIAELIYGKCIPESGPVFAGLHGRYIPTIDEQKKLDTIQLMQLEKQNEDEKANIENCKNMGYGPVYEKIKTWKKPM